MQGMYSLGIQLMKLGFHLVAPFHPKAKLMVEGRKKVFEQLQQASKNLRQPIWFHCASLGEFEQARPLIEALRKQSNRSIVLSFFSPSGFEIRKNYNQVDLVFYLPWDLKKNMQRCVQLLQPSVFFLTKYEVWPQLIAALNNHGVPSILFAANFRSNQIYFKRHGGYMRKALASLSQIFVQNQESQRLLKVWNMNAEVAGDPRFDRVWQVAQNPKGFPEIKEWISNHDCLVLGSSWEEDEKMLASVLPAFPKLKVILAPHEIHEEHIKQIEKIIPNSVRYSSFNSESQAEHQILIIDSIGHLSHLYQFAKLSYIGGGFGAGIHNTLEAAAHGSPVIFGPNHEKFAEAKGLIECEAALSFQSSEELKQGIKHFLENNKKAANAAFQYVEQHQGATQKILSLTSRHWQ